MVFTAVAGELELIPVVSEFPDVFQTRLLLIKDPGDCTSIFLPKSEQGNLFWATKLREIKEWEAPESNKITPGHYAKQCPKNHKVNAPSRPQVNFMESGPTQQNFTGHVNHISADESQEIGYMLASIEFGELPIQTG